MNIPVSGSTTNSGAVDSFWAYPRGTSIIQKALIYLPETMLATVGDTGNVKGKPPHFIIHYFTISLSPFT
ncbi:MAG: hypothetical protein KAJ23_15715 [Maribacter sp.]|nr:hypothetical protein [Maribacter sp.]